MKKQTIASYRHWTCTKCNWAGDYASTIGVMCYGVDWQGCPSCQSVAIPGGNMKLHPRSPARKKAKMEIADLITKMVEKYDLTFGEIIVILTEEIASWSKGLRKAEDCSNRDE